MFDSVTKNFGKVIQIDEDLFHRHLTETASDKVDETFNHVAGDDPFIRPLPVYITAGQDKLHRQGTRPDRKPCAMESLQTWAETRKW
jgi:hypothetical protein